MPVGREGDVTFNMLLSKRPASASFATPDVVLALTLVGDAMRAASLEAMFWACAACCGEWCGG
jgi:hypothetical protein